MSEKVNSIFSSASSSFSELSITQKMAKINEFDITKEIYMNEAWPIIQEALHQILTIRPPQFSTWSFEEIYSFVFKCTRNHLYVLYDDLTKYIEAHLQKVNEKIQISTCESIMFVKEFQVELFNFMESVKIIACVFMFMDNYYIAKTLKSTLTADMYKLFSTNVSDKYINHLLSILNELRKSPLVVPPSLIQDIIIRLHTIKPGYAQLKPQLFSIYIPNLFPPCRVSELDHYIREAKQLQTDLHSHPDFYSCDQSRKRPSSNDCNNYPQDQTTQQQLPSFPTTVPTTFNLSPNLSPSPNLQPTSHLGIQPNPTNPSLNPDFNHLSNDDSNFDLNQ
ncbi:hypothetical protein HELRODRAFT_192044 [Helobdella robusta]|uniref:Cullin N-terminal domain-containing protein n=1 Tax=Helobdella robusta TaxID=6412 RepID=T1FTJ4_HELRO|nr:hypothetical protein HELRODRAFT_192044 [Helobdella robusta]ESO03454.1 hypothetical protein HELRODRAFT_192044 [Helobdella robusta]